MREPAPQVSYAWRVDFREAGTASARQGREAATAPNPAVQPVRAQVVSIESRNYTAALRKRVALLLGFAYLLLYALASGLALPLIADPEPELPEEPVEGPNPPTAPPLVDYRPRPHPRPDPHEPGLHVRPDGSRYLVVPLNFAGAAA
ncbi:hypothetical protein [Glycomyces sp. NPDC048151]|uniref:hypothetical protein n=1 Tax=Glycomyces sp. NPDC048151 TaxID=3364002 RepID=UPI0037196195